MAQDNWNEPFLHYINSKRLEEENPIREVEKIIECMAEEGERKKKQISFFKCSSILYYG